MRVAGPALAAAALGAAPAAAVVGGAPDDGPLSRASVMVLGSNGGVCSAVVVAPDAVLTAAHCATGAAEHRVHWREASGEPVLMPARRDGASIPATTRRRSRPGGARSTSRSCACRSPLPARFEPATLSAAALRGGREPDARRLRRRPRGRGALDRHVPHRVARGRSSPSARAASWSGREGAPGAGACLGDSGGPIAGGGRRLRRRDLVARARARRAAARSRRACCSARSAPGSTARSPDWGRAARWEP